ncbi:multicopper oxidase family protein [Tsukamurella pseudospumae]|uniref:Multicopper oxidase CueO n=1 Tax=Tsukamurella pseudospumae TaxID=239498 RepID=A0A137ZLW3_9ACTN|nr:multicopper oxidase domain-containing protein [Tsukamurella pseudospumae]KXO99165.1 copper oxidase [Tsukamurella pseudospumae]
MTNDIAERPRAVAGSTRRTFLTALIAAPLAGAALTACRTSAVPAAPSLPGGRRALPVPPLARSVVGADGVRRFELTAQAGGSEIVAGKRSATWGFNGDILGPTLRARDGEKVAVTVRNRLAEATSVHWHGMHVPARADGGPHQMVEPGSTWNAEWTVHQRASTLWYHPHPHGVTEKHVYRGLSGFFLLDDDEQDRLGLPSEYGVDDIPVVVQDRKFTPDGELDETEPGETGLLGPTAITNGVAGASLLARRERMRLRLLNGASARCFEFGFADGRRFETIASDGGLLAAPVPMDRLMLSPGERAEIVVTVTAGERTMLRSYPISQRGRMSGGIARQYGQDDTLDVLELVGADVFEAGAGPVPRVLSTIAPLAAGATAPVPASRSFDLQWYMINGERMDMSRIDLAPVVDTTEVWTVRNKDNWPHNFHVHDVQFQITAFNGKTPPAHLRGWKDTVYLAPGDTCSLAMRFTDYTDLTMPYMYHCHLLFHEDKGMMGQFVVAAKGQSAPTRLEMPGMPGMSMPSSSASAAPSGASAAPHGGH